MKSKKENRVGESKLNNQDCLMKIVEYNNAKNIVVEFQDDHKARVHTAYSHFLSGKISNPYYPSIYNIGVVGKKYPTSINQEQTKEYRAWDNMLCRCFNTEFKNKRPTYKDVTCCNEWLLYENFHEWLHSQENFEKWLKGEKWAVDKDILIKGNKVYSPETCCLVPMDVNQLFLKNNAIRGGLPIGVNKDTKSSKYQAKCKNPFTGKAEYLGSRQTIEQSFLLYKFYKENIIKQVAKEEYDKGNITKQCYEAMMNYEVEITD